MGNGRRIVIAGPAFDHTSATVAAFKRESEAISRGLV
jgi:hypothetical protein